MRQQRSVASRARRVIRALTFAVATALAFAACGTATTSQPQATSPTVDRPCGWRTTPPATYGHVIWVIFENHSYGEVVGSSTMPFVNALAKSCGLATDLHNETHPSLPNYLAMVSGTTGGVSSSCSPGQCPQQARTLFAQVRAAGRHWRTYAETMPSACHRSNRATTYGDYVARHNPATYYPAIDAACDRYDVPMGTTSGGRFAAALAEDHLPSFSVLVPNTCHDSHDCSRTTADRWLKSWFAKIVSSPAYRRGKTALFLTWDEGSGGTRGEVCGAHRSDPSCHVATVVVSPTTRPGTRSATRFTHYSMLRTTERMFGISTLLGNARTASGLRGAFHL